MTGLWWVLLVVSGSYEDAVAIQQCAGIAYAIDAEWDETTEIDGYRYCVMPVRIDASEWPEGVIHGATWSGVRMW